MTLRTKPEDDDWQHIKDAKKRKQIQDRLAQRARRRRLREVAGHDNSTQQSRQRTSQAPNADSSPDATRQDLSHTLRMTALHDDTIGSSNLEASPNCQILDLDRRGNLTGLSPSLTNTLMSDSDLLPSNIHSCLLPPDFTEITIPHNIFTALYLNGMILGLSCGAELAMKSLPPTASTPLPLRPTVSQLTTVHYQWIDRLPFPKLRDSLIRLQGVVDLQDFMNDIFVMPSFEITRGAESWDPRAWTMQDIWARKWGWLFF